MKRLGKYELLEQLGRGGYGTVYRATDTVLEVERAVKVLHPQLAADPVFIERFQKEAKTAAKLDHSNIVRVYDLDEVGGRYFLVMEYMPCGSLKDRISREGHLSLEDALRIIEQIASALQYANARDLVHRDIKPGNILFDKQGTSKLGDFGFSKALSGASSQTISQTGGVIGTPAYMAPEVWENEPVGTFTDEYSLACVFYEAITGEVLFNTESAPAVIMRKHFKPLVLPEQWPEGVPGKISGVFETALAKDPQERFQDGLELIQAVKELVHLEDVQETINQEEAKYRQALVEQNWAQAAIIISKIENYGETGKEKAVELRDELAQTQQGHHAYLEKVAGIQAEGIQALSHIDLGLAETKITLLQSMGPEGLAAAEKLQKRVSSARRSAERSREWAETRSRVQPYLKWVVIGAGALIALMVVVMLWQRINIPERIAGSIQRESVIIPTVVESQVREDETQVVKPAANNAEATTPVQLTPIIETKPATSTGVSPTSKPSETTSPPISTPDEFEISDLIAFAQPHLGKINVENVEDFSNEDQDLFDTSGGGSVFSNMMNLSCNEYCWSTVRSNHTYSSGDAVILVFKFVPDAEIEHFLFKSRYSAPDYKRFGLNRNLTYGTHTSIYEYGEKTKPHPQRVGDNLKPDIWYKMLLAIKQDDTFLMAIEPVEGYAEFYTTTKKFDQEGSANLDWRLESQVQNGSLYIDRVIELSISGNIRGSETNLPSNPSTGDTWVSPVDGMALVYVPEGEFEMGSENGNESEKPVHTVYLDAFWIDQTEVTNAMYAAYLNDQGNQTQGGVNWLDVDSDDVHIFESGGRWQPEKGKEDHPAVEVTWYGAQAYCQWTGRRLPTEAEWEKAARGTDLRTYPWGEGIDCSRANYWGKDDGCESDTKPVGSYPEGASPYGVLDMAGNVWEWVADWYDSGYYTRSPDRNPQGPSSGVSFVLRGGSRYDDDYLRAAFRGGDIPDTSWLNRGFRCALSQ